MYFTVASRMLLILTSRLSERHIRITRKKVTSFRKNEVNGTEEFTFKDGMKLVA